MHKLILLFFSVCLSFSLFADQQKNIVFENTSKKELFTSKLICQDSISTGSFQNCNFELFQDNNVVKNSKIFLLGGMPQHKHGLPTSPKVIWSDEKNAYVIHGLKFSMPGEWLLDFVINTKEGAERDNILISLDAN